jgi:hypothetical protein
MGDPATMPDDSHTKGPGRQCPICRNAASEAWRPFCSRRCADIDLGRWLGGRYAIPGEPAGVSPDLESDEDC